MRSGHRAWAFGFFRFLEIGLLLLGTFGVSAMFFVVTAIKNGLIIIIAVYKIRFVINIFVGLRLRLLHDNDGGVIFLF